MTPINKPIMGKDESEAVLKVMESGILANPMPEGGPAHLRARRGSELPRLNRRTEEKKAQATFPHFLFLTKYVPTPTAATATMAMMT